MSANGSTTSGRLALTDSDSDAPAAPSAETPSSTLRRVLGDIIPAAIAASASSSTSKLAANHPTLARAIRVVMICLTVLGGGGAAVWVSTAPPERAGCDPIVLQHNLHLATTGEELAVALDADGRPDQAARVRDMTDPKRLPDDLQLCVLLQHRGATP